MVPDTIYFNSDQSHLEFFKCYWYFDYFQVKYSEKKKSFGHFASGLCAIIGEKYSFFLNFRTLKIVKSIFSLYKINYSR